MASLYDETLVDFDLNFLQPSTSNANVVRHDKQRQSILNVKKKIVSSSALLQKYYTQKERLEETECMLLAAKEECKQACIENKETLEKYTVLEMNTIKLKENNQQLVKNVADLQNQVEAMNSHAYQLQTLVKEKESMVEALKIEKELEKNSLKDYDKKIKSYEKERKAFLDDIKWFKDVVLGKKKVKEIKHILTKYKHMKVFDDGIESDNSCDLDDFDNSSLRSPSPTDNILCESLEKEHLFSFTANKEVCSESQSYKLKSDKLIDDHDSDFCNEVVSEDTGRGSSLALSEMNSPENDFMVGDFNIIIKEPIIQVDVGTSPMRVEENLISRPNMFNDKMLLKDASKTDYFNADNPFSSEIVTITEKRQFVDASTSPIQISHSVVHQATSPIIFEVVNEDINAMPSPIPLCNPEKVNTDSVKSTGKNVMGQMSQNMLSSGCELEISKKPAEELEKTNVNDEISNDKEVQMILSEMKLHDKMISPLPKRSKLHSHKIKEAHSVCPEVIKIREENKTLKTNVDFLCKEVKWIKSLLANKNTLTEKLQTETESDIFDNRKETVFERENNCEIELGENSQMEINNPCEEQTDYGSRYIATARENDPRLVLSSNTTLQSHLSLEDDNTNESKSVESNIICQDTVDEAHDQTRSSHSVFSRDNKTACGVRLKRRKQTKLDVLKRNIMPRSKIMTQLPVRRIKKIPIKPIVRKDLKNKLLDIMNNKDAYDKARRVMFELKSKEKIVKKREIRSNIRNIPDRSSDKVSKKKNVKKKNLSNPITIIDDIAKEKSSNNAHSIVRQKINRHVISSMPSSPSSLGTDIPSSSVSNSDSGKNIPQCNDEIICKEDNTDNVNLTKNESKPITVDIDKQDSILVDKDSTPKTNRRRKRIDSDSSNVSYKRMLRSSNTEKIEAIDKPGNKENRVVEIDYNDLDMFDTTETVVEKENIDNVHSLGNTTNEETDANFNKVKRRLRVPSNNSDTPKRLLRSSNLQTGDTNTDRSENKLDRPVNNMHESEKINEDHPDERLNVTVSRISTDTNNLSNSILCKMIKKYGKNVIKTSASKVSDKRIDAIFAMIDTTLSDTAEKPQEQQQKAVDDLIQYLQGLNRKEFISALMKYLQDPARKLELYSKTNTKVPMTKKEQMIVYIIKQMNDNSDVLQEVLKNIDFALFCLSKNPEFDAIESLSHLYAVLCRVFNLKNRLKVFMLDAMYCLNFKAVVVVKQCLTTWPHVLPLAHLPHAKSPLVLSMVYLLHFLKCDNRGMKRASDVRWLLDKKYMFNFNDWNHNKILEMLSNAIKTIRDDPAERNMLRMAIIIFAKRQGVKWCQKNIINNLLLPSIENESTSERVKVFCIKVLGPLFKAYPVNMKVHCEIITNRLLDMLEQENLSHAIKEGIFTSLICMSKHNPQRVISALLKWQPECVSTDFETLIKSYVREKPIKAWKKILSKTN